ncbi:hypothetical protein FN846DRAFT_912486 [Sphaerosporella brunnea]|uniref:Uncharacterized protein n=1 Tax=Sphaerosporella brunnea TaxID=1250544 RepID=A0A5J5EHB6_9PEZI|nr:hypothetical protein FN846DRAFT_912486 [Sphaerosporella brunnea]
MDNPAPPSPKNQIATICPFINIPNELHLEILGHLCDGDWSVGDHISLIMALLYTTGNQALDCYIGTLPAPSYPHLLRCAVRQQLPVSCLGRILRRLPDDNVDAIPAARECIERNAVRPLELLLKFIGSKLAMQLGYAILMGRTESAVVMAKGMDKENLAKAVEGHRKIEWGDRGISVLTILVQAVQRCGCLPAGAVSCLEAVLDVVNERLDNSGYPQPCPLETLAECVFAIPGFIADPMQNPKRDWVEIQESGEWTWKCRAIPFVDSQRRSAAIRGPMPSDVDDRFRGSVQTAALSNWRQLWGCLLRLDVIAQEIAHRGGTRRIWDLPTAFVRDLLDRITFSVSARRMILMWAVRFRDPEKVQLVFSHLSPPFPIRSVSIQAPATSDDSMEGGFWSADGDLCADAWNGYVGTTTGVEDADDGRVKLFPPGALGGLWNAVIDDILETGTMSPAVDLIQQMHADDAGVHALHEQRNGVPLLHALLQLGFLHPETLANHCYPEEGRREKEKVFLERRSPLRRVISILIAAGAKTEEPFQWRDSHSEDSVTPAAPRYFFPTCKYMPVSLVYEEYEFEGPLRPEALWGVRTADIHTPHHVAIWARCLELFPAWTGNWSVKGLCGFEDICAVPPLLTAAALTDADAVLKLCTPQDISYIIASLESFTELTEFAWIRNDVIAYMVFVLVTVVKSGGSGWEEMERWDLYCVQTTLMADSDKRPFDMERYRKGFSFVVELFRAGNWRREHADAPWARALVDLEKAA